MFPTLFINQQVFLIPVDNIPQTFEILLGGVSYLLTVKFNDSLEGGWLLDIADTVTSASIAAGIPFVTGVDLLAGLEYLGIGGSLIVYTDGNQTAVPTYENLGVESNLYFVTEAAA